MTGGGKGRDTIVKSCFATHSALPEAGHLPFAAVRAMVGK